MEPIDVIECELCGDDVEQDGVDVTLCVGCGEGFDSLEDGDE